MAHGFSSKGFSWTGFSADPPFDPYYMATAPGREFVAITEGREFVAITEGREFVAASTEEAFIAVADGRVFQ